MADLGAIGKSDPLSPGSVLGTNWTAYSSTVSLKAKHVDVFRRVIPRWDDNPKWLEVSVSGVISGIVKVGGVPRPWAKVALIYRTSMEVISMDKSDINGLFSFDHLDPAQNKYVVLAVDPSDTVTYNAQVFDRVVPFV